MPNHGRLHVLVMVWTGVGTPWNAPSAEGTVRRAHNAPPLTCPEERHGMTRVKRWAAGALAAIGAVAAVLTATTTPAGAIVGGTTGEDVAYFSMISIENANNPSQNTICGGTVISTEWILTAGHCITAVPNRTGVFADSCLRGQCVWSTADQIIVHPLWDGDTAHGHDLALLHIRAGSLPNAVVVPRVGAPWDPGAYAPGTPAKIMGYGRTSANGPLSHDLRTANTVLVSDSAMSDVFNPLPLQDNYIPSLMIGVGSSTVTTCYGDSGGPAIVHRNGLAVVVGVVSMGYDSPFDPGCDNPDA